MRRAAVWGLGAMGSSIARLAAERRVAEITAALDVSPSKVGRTLDQVAGPPCPRVPVDHADLAPESLRKAGVELVFLATSSYLRDVAPQILTALESGSSVVTIAEEMIYPWAADPALADRIHRVAVKVGRGVLGIGVNPGYVMDLLPLVFSGPCRRVDKVKVFRCNDLSPYGPAVLRSQGVGLDPEEFEDFLIKGRISGHVGFRQSMALVALGLGWELEEFRETVEPIVARIKRVFRDGSVEPGMVAGSRHRAVGYTGGRPRIEFDHPQQVDPGSEGIATADVIELDGDPPLRVEIRPEIPGGAATAALAVNAAPALMAAGGGLYTVLDFPVPRCRDRNPALRLHPVSGAKEHFPLGDRGRPGVGGPGAGLLEDERPDEGRLGVGGPSVGLLDGEQREESGQDAARGDWVQIRKVILEPGERSEGIPAVTAATPFEVRVRGYLQEDAGARVGGTAVVRTPAGRLLRGILTDADPAYKHGFGLPSAELHQAAFELARLSTASDPDPKEGSH